MSYCVKLTGEDLLHYSNKIESVGLRKCSHYHCQESNVTITNLLQFAPYHSKKTAGTDMVQRN